MAYKLSKVAIYGLIGILGAVLVIASVTLAPSLFPMAQAKTGTLVVKVTDAPVRDLVNLNLTIDLVEALNVTGSWIVIPIPGGTSYFDLLKLENVTRDLAIGQMPVGNFTKIRMRIVSANATLGDGRRIELNVPPGHVDIKADFEIKPGKTTSLIIDIVVDKIKIAERGNSGEPANLNPQFKAIVVPPT